MEIQRQIILTEAGISGEKLVTEECVDSTNLLASRLAAGGAPSGTAVIAGAQTAGRGRLGRTFYSPENSGLYLSLIVRAGALPKTGQAADVCAGLTAAAGTCVAESIDELFGTNTRIKWVNDIIIDGRKAGGILTEGRIEGGGLSFAVIGIGVNIYNPSGGFPETLRGIAGAVNDLPALAAPVPGADPDSRGSRFAASFPREALAGRIIKKLNEQLYATAENEESASEALYEKYLKRVEWMFGKDITVKSASGAPLFDATAKGLTRNFGLAVKDQAGSASVLTSGEVSVRLQEPK